jgi:heme exporter protein B
MRRSGWTGGLWSWAKPDGTRHEKRLVNKAIAALFLREWRNARRIGGGASTGAVFFLILVAIMPFAIGPDLNLLARIGPAILWVAALLSTLLGLDRLFQSEDDDGALGLLINTRLPLELVVLVKCAAHWTATALPLIVISPLFGLMLALDAKALGLVALSLLAGTPALTMIGAIGAALTVSLRRGGLLMAVLVLPLTIPALIFGVSAASAASGGAAPFLMPFLVLCALSLAAIAGAPFAAAAALRIARS